MRRKLLIMSLLVALLVGLVGSATAAELTKVRVAEVVRSVFYAPFYAAITQGLFAEEGIEIVMDVSWGADKGAAALLSGAVDVGFFGPEAGIYVYAQGRRNHFVVFAELTACDGSFLVGREPEPDFSWANLKGKTIIGGRPGGVPEMTLEWLIKQSGLDPFKDVTLIRNLAFTATAGAFQSGIGDYVALFEPTASLLEKEGIGYVVASLGADAGPQAYTAFHASKEFIARNSDLIQRFTNAVYRGQIWVYNHTPEEITAAILEFFPDMDYELILKSVARYQAIDAWQRTPILSEEAFNKLQDIMISAGELAERTPFAELVDNSFAEKAVRMIQ
ncbi:MAG: ABC transporter substrate-binding protein [Firmicutes bacterium]|nr:ABC transporter substrate-binding protein [Bacillota bacterium]